MNAVIQQFTPEELLDRNRWIGGSDAAAAVSLNPYASQFDLWQEKLGIIPPFIGNERTRWGKLHEPVVRQETAERRGVTIKLPPDVLVHPRFAFAACHPDGIIDDGRVLYEGKTARYPDGFGEEGTDQVPQHYLVQCQHNMGIIGAERTILSTLIGGSELRIYDIPADKEMQQMLFEAEARFWHYVQEKCPPPPDLSRADALEVLKRMYPGTSGEIIQADEAAAKLRASWDAQKLIAKNATALADQAKAALLAAMGEATFLAFPDGKSLRRAIVNRKGYEVKASSYIDARYVNT